MVRTRLSEGHEGTSDAFLPVRTRNSRSGSEEVISTIRDGHFDDSPQSKKRIFDLGSGSSGNLRDSPVYSTRTRRQSKFTVSEDSETPKRRGQASSPRSTRRGMSRQTRRSVVLDDTPAGDYEDESKNREHLRRSGPSVYGRRQMNSHESSPKTEPRRSNRRRKPIYATMNQRLLGVDLYAWTSPKRTKSPERKNPSEEDNEGKDAAEEEAEDDEHEEEEEEDDEEEEDEERRNDQEEIEELERLDMYSRVKQRHIKARKMREQQERTQREEEERQLKKQEGESDEEETSDEDSDEEDSSDEESEEETRGKNYHLRKHRAPTKRFEVPVEVRMPRRQKSELEDVFGTTNSPIRRRYPKSRKHLTPIRSPRFKRRKHHATHHSSSTSSEGSDDERRFERRKSKSMAKARMRCLPMNLKAEDVSSGVLRDRQKIGSSLADVDPMNIDTSITFESVGGLNKHIQALKEMVVFPLLYPEVFTKFKINPPRGVLFHGPPGTGKTLVARALANECKNGDKKVAFFMRKGADCLSKWVGESERQLRLLFDQAYTMRPSIIFFDEIDGLAPVRSSRQDQIHSSIVSTLLALMDGLDCRGEIVVIGATNRIDSIDPALRRPGRFDREFLFQLPSCQARQSILSIHTSEWNPKLADSFLAEVAERCVGYCGADLKALCTETALYALRHQFPQIYASKEKLQLDLSQIQVSARDFHLAMQNIVPAAQRAVVSPGRALSVTVRPLLKGQLDFMIDGLKKFFPVAFGSKKASEQGNNAEDVIWELLNGDVYDDDEGPSIFVTPNPRKKRRTEDGDTKSFLNFTSSAFSAPSHFRPRLLISGESDQGHSTHVAPAILHRLEGLPVHCLDLPALYAVSARNPEESCAQVFHEARRTAPSIIYMPHIVQWWQASGYTVKATFLTLLQDLPPTSPILLLATADCAAHDIPQEVTDLFTSFREMYNMRNPTSDERREFFTELLLVNAVKPPPKRKQIAAKALEVIPVAEPQQPQRLTETEEFKLRESEEATLRELRIFLREVLSRIALERKFRNFAKAVDPEEVPDYFAVIKNPMDLSTMMNKINMHEYTSAKDFLVDIDLITSNALEYNPDQDPSDRQIRNYACELKDMAYAIIDAEMDSDFEQTCVDIATSRIERGGGTNSKDAPSFYRTLPQLQRQQAQEVAKRNPMPNLRITPCSRTLLSPNRTKKKRRRSAWSRGCIPKPKKKEPKLTAETDGGENEEDREESKEEENGMENGEEEDDEEEEEEEKVGEHGDDKEDNSDKDNYRGRDKSSEDVEMGDGQEEEEEEEGEEDGERQNEEEGLEDENTEKSNSNQLEKIQSEKTGNWADLNNGIVDDSDDESIKSAPANVKESSHVVDKRGDGNSSQMNGIDGTPNESSNDGSEKQVDETQEDGGDEVNTSGIQEQILSLTKPAEIPLRRVTRRMLADHNSTRAVEILDEPEPDLIIDKQRLQNLLDRAVTITSNWAVYRLEMLHCRLSQCIYRHRMEYNKIKLIQEMEEICESTLTSANPMNI